MSIEIVVSVRRLYTETMMSIDAKTTKGLTSKLIRCPCPISNIKIDSGDIENYSYFEWNLKLVVCLPIILITSVRTPTKFIIHKCRGVSLVEQDKIEYVSWTIQNSLLNFFKEIYFFTLILCNKSSIFKKTWKKRPQNCS